MDRGGGRGPKFGKRMGHKMRVVERKRMSLLAKQSERKWRNACELDTHTHTNKHTSVREICI